MDKDFESDEYYVGFWDAYKEFLLATMDIFQTKIDACAIKRTNKVKPSELDMKELYLLLDKFFPQEEITGKGMTTEWRPIDRETAKLWIKSARRFR